MDEPSFEVEDPTPLLPEPQPDDPPLLDLPPQQQRPPARHKRLVQISLVLLASIVAFVTFHSVIPARKPAPSTTLPGLQRLTDAPARLVSNINFGSVTINHHPQHGTFPIVFMLHHGASSTITINAPPFQPRSCVVSYAEDPAQSTTPTCAVWLDSGTVVYTVVIDFTAADLPPEQQEQVTTLLAHSITAQQTSRVPAGSYIATRLTPDDSITSQRTATSLQATAFLSASATGMVSSSCRWLTCPLYHDLQSSGPYSGKVWAVNVPVALRWRFPTASGRVLGDVSYPAAGTVLVLLADRPSAGWSLSSQSAFAPFNTPDALSTLDCGTGAQLLQQQLPLGMSVSWSASNGQALTGCQWVAQTYTNAKQGTFIWRFGVLLAADKAAHRLLPTLPIAPQAEIAAVQGAP
jgi:hypothetical protein